MRTAVVVHTVNLRPEASHLKRLLEQARGDLCVRLCSETSDLRSFAYAVDALHIRDELLIFFVIKGKSHSSLRALAPDGLYGYLTPTIRTY